MNAQELTSTKEKQVLRSEERTRPERYFVPDVDIRETDDAVFVHADMPGVSKDGAHVELEGDTLTIEGDVTTSDYEGLMPLYTEYNVGNWVRRFTFPAGHRLDPQQVSARLTNGVLEIRLPKSERARARKVPIEA